MNLLHFTFNQLIPLSLSSFPIISSLIYFNIRKTKVSLVLLLIGSLLLGFAISNLDPFLCMWDEQYHALVAKNLISNPFKPTLYPTPVLDYDYHNWTSNYVWLHKQPLFLWQIALSIKLFGCNELAVRIPSILLHALTSILIYRIGKITYSTKVGYYAAFLFTTLYYPLELVAGKFSTDHNDISFIFYVTASFWAWFEYQETKKNYFLILIGLFSGSAVLVKWLVGLLIYPIWILSIGISNKKNWFQIKSYAPISKSIFITLLIFLPWQIYILMNFPIEAKHEFAYNTHHFFESLEGHTGTIWFHINATKDLYGAGDAVPFLIILGLFYYIKNIRSKIYGFVVLSSITVTYVFYSIAATKMTSYCLIVSPFIVIGLASLFDSFFFFLQRKIKYESILKVLNPIVLLIISYSLLNISKIQRRHTFENSKYNSNRMGDFKTMDLIKILNSKLNGEPYVIFNINVRIHAHIPVMFYTNYIAYDIIPNQKQLTSIKNKLYKLAIIDDNKLPYYIILNPSILKIRI